MRQDILEYLLQHKGEFVSGQRISESCGISRTAVWKHIRVLKERGYQIESYTRKGYCLMEAPELLSAEIVSEGLATKVLGKSVHYYEKVDSTNTIARKLAEEGVPDGTVVLAEEQTGGRGRLARTWYSPFGQGVWFSLILRPSFVPMEAAKMTLLAAVSLTKAFRKLGLIDCGIKWPNDILVKGRKLVGILTELNASMEQIHYIIMGIGINTGLSRKDLPKDLKKTVTSFAMENSTLSRKEILQEVLYQLEAYYELAQQAGFGAILQEWKLLSVTLGQNVEVTMPDKVFTGKAVDLDDNGNLLVDTDMGREVVMAGDVRIRPAAQ